MAKTKQFKTESKKLLDLMINSIYTHKEIFIRELISNASDAIDKRHYLALTNTELMTDYEIIIELDETDRTITIKDNGVGLTEEELINNYHLFIKYFEEQPNKFVTEITKEIDLTYKLENGQTLAWFRSLLVQRLFMFDISKPIEKLKAKEVISSDYNTAMPFKNVAS